MRVATALTLVTLLWLPAAQSQTEGDDRKGAFEGYWVATGTRDGVPFPADRQVFVFSLAGSLNLKTDRGAFTDLWASCVGLRDTVAGTDARCVWENAAGDRVFSELTSSGSGATETASGRFVGGTGRLAGITGGYSYTWETLFFEERDDRLSGFIREIRGHWELP